MFRPLLIASSAALALGCAVANAQSSSTVKLLEPGTGQLQPLRYRFQSGRTETAKLDTTMQISIAAPGMQMPVMPATPIGMEIRLRTSEVAADGSAKVQFEVLSAEASGAAAAQVNAALAAVKGLSGTYSVDSRGQVGSTPMTVSGAASAAAPSGSDIQEQMQQMALPLPAEAVGPGARWQARQQTNANGLEVTQTTEYTLRSRNGDLLELDVKIIDVSLPDLSAMVPGATVNSATMSGGGPMTVNLASLVPRGSLDIDMAIAMSMALQGASQSMSMQMKMQQAIAPAAARAN